LCFSLREIILDEGAFAASTSTIEAKSRLMIAFQGSPHEGQRKSTLISSEGLELEGALVEIFGLGKKSLSKKHEHDFRYSMITALAFGF